METPHFLKDTSLYFPHEISCCNTPDDIRAIAKLLLTNAVENLQFIDEPTVRLISYPTCHGACNIFTSVKYPIWEQKITFTYQRENTDAILVFHEINHSLCIHREPFIDYEPYYDKVVPDWVPVARKFIVSRKPKRVKTIYDDTFSATARQAVQKLLNFDHDLQWSHILSIEPKVRQNGQAVWWVEYGYERQYFVDVVSDLVFEYNKSRYQYTADEINPYDTLRDPVVGNDYFAFDWRSPLLEHIYNIAALRFTGEEFTLVPFGQAKLPTLDPDANWLRQI